MVAVQVFSLTLSFYGVFDFFLEEIVRGGNIINFVTIDSTEQHQSTAALQYLVVVRVLSFILNLIIPVNISMQLSNTYNVTK